jgi:hypothetical protein
MARPVWIELFGGLLSVDFIYCFAGWLKNEFDILMTFIPL